MRVIVAPDSFGGTLTSVAAARAIAEGWRSRRPDDEVVLVPLADGGEGTLETVRRSGDRIIDVEVADPLGRPVIARFALRDRVALVESAEACGLALLTAEQRDPLRTTTYGVGQLLEAARTAGAERVVLGIGGSATVDGGAGAVAALGGFVRDAVGDGVKIGGGELTHVARVEPRWRDPGWERTDVVIWADVATLLADAARLFGPQKGATPDAVRVIGEGIDRWAEVVERDLGGRWRDVPGSGAAGGLGFGVAAFLGATITPGAQSVAEEVGLYDALEGADVVVTGEGRLDATSTEGKVVGYILEVGARERVPVVAVVGRSEIDLADLADIEEAAPEGPGSDVTAEVRAAASRLADRFGNARLSR